MCNICDDKLLDLVGKEMSHHGLFVSVSKIEALAIKIYDTVNSTHPKAKLNSNNKDDYYYSILSTLICGDLLAEARLAKSRNAYEATAILTLLQSYLDNFTITAKLNRVRAPEVFMDILEKLPFEMTFTKQGDGWSTTVQKVAQSPGQAVTTKKCRLCTNVEDPGIMCECTEQDGPGGCFDNLTFSVVYKNLCIGFKIDTDILGLDKTIYKDELPEYTKIMKNIIDKAATEIKSQAQEIFLMIYEEHKND